MMKNISTRFGFIVATTSLAFVVSQLDVSIVNVALPEIGKSFAARISTLQWVVDAYTIAFAVFMLSAGGMGDLLGAKRLFQLGLLVFTLASAGCGIAWNAAALVGFRVIQGMGSAIMIPSSLSILNHSFADDLDQRAHAVALWTAAGGVSIAAGPVLGGLLLHFASWRWIFFVNLPVGVLGLLLSIRLKESGTSEHRGFDIPGQGLWMLALTTLIAAIIEWHEAAIPREYIYGSLGFSFVMLVLFLAREKRAVSPILPLNLFASRNFNLLIGLGMILNGSYYGLVFVLSLYLQNVLHYPGLQAGLAFLPLTGSFIISNLVSSRLIRKYGIRVPIRTGLLISAVGFALLLLAGRDTPYWVLLPAFFGLPLGMGTAVPAMTTGVLATVDRNRSGIASAVLNTTRQAAGAVGVAVFGAMTVGGADAIVRAVTESALISAGCLFVYFLVIFRTLKN
jgi:DHA2 family methylenomycin A resistance protein-like MFS transporter